MREEGGREEREMRGRGGGGERGKGKRMGGNYLEMRKIYRVGGGGGWGV